MLMTVYMLMSENQSRDQELKTSGNPSGAKNQPSLLGPAAEKSDIPS